MRIIVNNELKEITYIDPNTGIDCFSDMCGDEIHSRDERTGEIMMTPDEFEAWEESDQVDPKLKDEPELER